MLAIVCLVVLLTLALWFLQGQRSEIRRNGKRLPRPPNTLPLAGNGLWFLQPRHKLLDWFAEIQPTIGFETYEISIPSLPPAIVVNDPKNVEHVLKNHELFIKGLFFRLRSYDLFGDGIINADGQLWKTQRKAGLKFFGNSNIKSFVEDALPPLLADTQRCLDVSSKAGVVLDLQNVILELTTRLMGKMAYDMDMHSSDPFSKAFDFASGCITDRFTNPFWKLKELIFGNRLRKDIKDIKEFGHKIVSTSLEKRRCAQTAIQDSTIDGGDSPSSNLINALLDNIDDHQEVADAAMNFLSAGRDTTAQSITWTFYNLMRHPEQIHHIRTELQTAFQDFNLSQSLPLSFDTIQPSSLPYTMAVFNETIRLYPPVPFELKECTAPTTFPDGTWLPKGAVVLWVPWSLGRSTLIWGEDSTEFKPQRWLHYSDNGKPPTLVTKTAYEFPVFNAGPRTCLGKRMAELLAVYAIASLVWEYDFEEIVDPKRGGCGVGKERISQNSLTLPMKGGLPCTVQRRAPREGQK